MRKSSIAAVVAALVMGTVVAVPAAFAEGATRSTVDSVSPGDPSITGTSTLVRTDSGVSVRYRVVGLTPGNVYSAWVATNGFPPPAEQLTGRVVGPTGVATFAGHIREGGVLENAATDTVIIVIVNHGPKVPGSVRVAMTSPPFCSSGPCGPVIHAEHAP